MRILALETSGLAGSVALLDGPLVVHEAWLPPGQGSARTLAPAIKEALARAQWDAKRIELVAVSIGPGSFTGLRIGVVTAKMLAYVAQANVVAVPTLDVIAFQVPVPTDVKNPGGAPWIATLSVAADAHRSQVYEALYHPREGRWTCTQPARIVNRQDWANSLAAGTMIAGPWLAHASFQQQRGMILAPQETWLPRAASIGQLGWERFNAGQADDMWTLTPLYLRPSAAEERR